MSQPGIETSKCGTVQFAIPSRDNPLANVELVERGMPVGHLNALGCVLDLDRGELLELFRISPRTYARRKTAGAFDTEESERLLRVMRVVEAAVGLFEGDVAEARAWLFARNEATSGKSPLEFSITGPGAEFVLSYIGRIEHGIPT